MLSFPSANIFGVFITNIIFGWNFDQCPTFGGQLYLIDLQVIPYEISIK